MKRTFFISVMILLLVGAGCKKTSGGGEGTPSPETVRDVSTYVVTDITKNSARLNGYMRIDDAASMPIRTCFLLIDNAHVDKGDAYYPTVEQMIAGGAQTVEVTDGMTGEGLEREFYADVTSLKGKTWYFCCAFAEFEDEVVYGGVVSFWTASAEIENLKVSNVTATSMAVSFRYDGNDVAQAKLEWKAGGGSFQGEVTAYSLDNYVYTFQMDNLYPNLKYNIEVKILTTSGYEKSALISEVTLKGIVTERIVLMTATYTYIVVRAWPNAYTPTIYYSSDAYTISEDYKSATMKTMSPVSGDNSLFEAHLTGLTPGTKYWFVADNVQAVMEINSFTTPNLQ